MVSGGDHNPDAGAIAFAEGIAAVDTAHLHTFHAHPGKSSAERFKGARWHTLSAAYTYFPAMETDTAWQYKHVYTQLYEEMLNRYKMPCILLESAYERERHITTQGLRRQAYWALLSGASGAFFGHRDLYQLQKRDFLRGAYGEDRLDFQNVRHTTRAGYIRQHDITKL